MYREQRVTCTGNNLFHVGETHSALYRKQSVSCRGNNLFHVQETHDDAWHCDMKGRGWGFPVLRLRGQTWVAEDDGHQCTEGQQQRIEQIGHYGCGGYGSQASGHEQLCSIGYDALYAA